MKHSTFLKHLFIDLKVFFDKKLKLVSLLSCFIPFVISAQTIVHDKPFPPGLINQGNQNLSGTGDGYNAIPYKDRFYIINHHKKTTDTSFLCVDRIGTTGCNISNIIWPTKLSDGDLITNYSSTTAGSNEEYYIRGGKLYYPVTRFDGSSLTTTKPKDWGMGCFDLDTHSECGYDLLSNNPNKLELYVGIEGPFVDKTMPDKLFFLDLEMKLYCLSIATLPATDCGTLSLPFTAGVGMPMFSSDRASQDRAGHIAAEVVDGKLYVTVIFHRTGATSFNPQSAKDGKYAMCITTNSMSPCQGWMNTGGAKKFNPAAYSLHDNHSNFIYYVPTTNQSIVAKSICSQGKTVLSCLDLGDGSTVTHNPVANTSSFNYGLGGEVKIGGKTYFPEYFANEIHCFNWMSGQNCSGYPKTTSQSADDYALSVDPAGCLWAYGHNKKLWSLDPITRVSPCNLGSFTGEVEKSCPLDNWLDFNVTGITQSDYESLKVLIKNNQGIWVEFDLLGVLPITLGPQFSGVNPLQYEIKAAMNVLSFTNSAPRVKIRDTNNNSGKCIGQPSNPRDGIVTSGPFVPPRNDFACEDGTKPPCQPKPNLCCTPWTKDKLKQSFNYLFDSSGGMIAKYTLKYQEYANTHTQLESYVTYLKSLNSTIDHLNITYDMTHHGTGLLPVPSTTPAPNTNSVSMDWDTNLSPVTPMVLYANYGYPLLVNNWYRLSSIVSIYDINNRVLTGLINKEDCTNAEVYFNLKVQDHLRVGSGSKAGMVLQISDGKKIIETIEIGGETKPKPSLNKPRRLNKFNKKINKLKNASRK